VERRGGAGKKNGRVRGKCHCRILGSNMVLHTSISFTRQNQTHIYI
jgi:hypothetical protein